MPGTLDWSTQDLTRTRPKLLDELVFVPQCHSGETFYHVEIPSKSRFYRIGYREYVFVSLLDGKTTFAQALTMTARVLGPDAISQQAALGVYTWLVENKLAYLPHGHAPSESRRTAWSLLRNINPFWTKLPLALPSGFFRSLQPIFGWLFSPIVTAANIVLIACGLVAIFSHWDRFKAASEIVYAPANWVWMLAAWLLLKIVHELAHGCACKRYGGDVREVGLVFVLFAPMAFVDVTSSWRFSSKWQRIHVAAAGMYVELALAALAALAWTQVENQYVSHLLYSVVLMASITTILFNANPLMRFDGYYILSDLLGIPNLYDEGTKRVRYLLGWLFFGSRQAGPRGLGSHEVILKMYGVASAIWRMLVCVSLAVAASLLFKGAGLFLAVAGIAMWLGQGLFSMSRNLWQHFQEHRPSFIRAVAVGTALASCLWLSFAWLPWPRRIVAPAIVEFADDSIVRATSPGFVDRIHVKDGQTVASGDRLIELRNEDLDAEVRELQIQIEQVDARQRIAMDEQNTALTQIELRNRAALEERLAAKRRQQDGLSVRSPVPGRVAARKLEAMAGMYIKEGQELLAVGREDRKELIVSIHQDDIDEAFQSIKQSVRLRTGTQPSQRGQLSRIDPRASQTLPHPAMSALEGGPLAVTESTETQRNEHDVRLVEPRFKAVVSVSEQTSRGLSCGQQGYVVLGWNQDGLGRHLLNRFMKWLDSQRSSRHP